MMKKNLATEKAPAALGPYSQGVRTGNLIFVSGQLPIDRSTGTMPATIEEQTATSLSNIRFILESEGVSMDRVVKTTVFLSDMNNFAAMNGVYGRFFSEGCYPARSAVQAARLPKDAMIEIEAIAEAD